MIKKEDIQNDMDAVGIETFSLFKIDDANRSDLEKRERRIYEHLTKSEAVECAPHASERFFVLGAPSEFKPITVLVIAMPYDHKGYSIEQKMGTVDAFAWDYDYHQVLREKLMAIQTLFEKRHPNLSPPELCVDTSRYIDREVAFYAGLGRYGHNHMLIHPKLGTAFFIGYMVFRGDLEIEKAAYNPVVLEDDLFEGCQSCERCIRACPAEICGHEKMAPNRCVGMLTQTKRPLKNKERHQMGHRLYGCNVCQRVCPANSIKDVQTLLSPKTENAIDPKAILMMSNKAFKKAYGHMAFSWRSLWVYKRNALINLGNCGTKEDLKWLEENQGLQKTPLLQEIYDWAVRSLKERLR